VNATHGTYFRRDDYAGFWLRLLIDVIDLLVVGGACLLIAAAWIILLPSVRIKLLLAACTAFVFCYFVPLKRSRMRTLGYRIGRVRIVGVDGGPASFFALSLRLAFATLGPLNWFLDLTWLAGDRHRQALRDKFAQTYVVKLRATPAGSGKLLYQYYELLGYHFLFREVTIENATSGPSELIEANGGEVRR
jgi:uncharacterized RDD family membrane protein YckC